MSCDSQDGKAHGSARISGAIPALLITLKRAGFNDRHRNAIESAHQAFNKISTSVSVLFCSIDVPHMTRWPNRDCLASRFKLRQAAFLPT